MVRQQPRRRDRKAGAAGLTSAFSIELTLPLSLPGLTGQSSIHGRRLLDRPVKPGDDSTEAGQPLQQDRDRRAGVFYSRLRPGSNRACSARPPLDSNFSNRVLLLLPLTLNIFLKKRLF